MNNPLNQRSPGSSVHVLVHVLVLEPSAGAGSSASASTPEDLGAED